MPTDSLLGIPTVYLVDDEGVVRDALAWLLRTRRLLSERFASADAFDAWLTGQQTPGRATRPGAPSCLVLDMRMPGTSGLTLFERLAEREVMKRVLTGRPNKLIADDLQISVRTVEVQRARVFDKMHVRSAVELAKLLGGREAD